MHLADKPNGAAIVICPGGGYGGLVTKGEGHGIAAWLNKQGITGIVLEYRLPAGRPYVPLLDAQQAIRTVRANAAQWKIDPKKVGIIGFSAGGHLASTATVHFETIETRAPNAVTSQSSRPDFSILIYPVISMDEGVHRGSKKNLMGETPAAGLSDYFSSQKHVKADTPPAFLAHALDDKVVPIENSRIFFEAEKEGRFAHPPRRTAQRRPRPQRLQRPVLGQVAGRIPPLAEGNQGPRVIADYELQIALLIRSP